MGKKFEVSTIFKGIDKMSAPISRIQNKIGTMARTAGRQIRGLQRTTDKWTRGVTNAGKKVAAVGLIAAAGLGTATGAGIEFEQTMVNASAKFGDSAKRGTANFKAIEDAAKRTGASTEFSATQSAEALNFLAMAGFSAEQSVAALPGVVDLATAAQVDLASATDIATDTLGAFGLESKNAQQQALNLARVNDVLAKTATTSNTSMEQLFQALKKGGPIATTTGASIETVAAMVGTMANAGIKAEVAGTAVANAFLNLSSPASGAQKVMKRLGIQVKDLATGNLKDMPDLIDELNAKTKDLTKTQRLAALEAIFGREGLAGTSKVVAQGGDALRKYRERLEGAQGAAGDMAKEMRDTTRGSLNSLKSAIEGVSITLFATNRGPMKDAIDMATKWVRANGDIIAQNIGQFFLDVAANIDTVVAAGKGIGGLIALLWGVNLALKAIAGSTAAVNAVMMVNPLVLLVTTFAALVYLSENFNNRLRELPELVQKAFSNTSLGTLSQGLYMIRASLPDMDTVMGGLGMGDASTPEMSSPQERNAHTITENIKSSTNELTIKDETGRAEIRNIKGPQRLTITQTGGM